MRHLVLIPLLLLLTLTISLEAQQKKKSPADPYRNAVFQRDAPININLRYKSTTGPVSITFNGQTQKKNIHQRKASATFPAMKAGGPYTLTIKDADGEHKAEEIYIGDIWVCVGQSNMVFGMTRMHKDATWEPASNDNYPLVRLSGRNGWRKATNIEGIKHWPGTPYYFARHLNRELGIAIGLKVAGAGGTSLWQWLPEEAFAREDLKPLHEKMKARVKHYNEQRAKGTKLTKYPPMEGFSPEQFYPRKPKTAFSLPNLTGIEKWAGKVPSRGIIFWQGEDDLGSGANYEPLFRTLIQRYQKHAGRDFPFYFVQLPTYEKSAKSTSRRDGFEGLRDAQRRVAESEKNVHMVVSYDMFDGLGGIHPANKQEVGTRLANAVLGHTYKKDVAWIHAKYDKIEIAGSTLKVHFKDTGKGLKTKDGKAPMAFTLAGEDGKFYPAEARIVGGTMIELKSAKVSKPVAVRYAWSRVPNTNLVGDGDLPVSPFRSDNWELYPVK